MFYPENIAAAKCLKTTAKSGEWLGVATIFQ